MTPPYRCDMRDRILEYSSVPDRFPWKLVITRVLYTLMACLVVHALAFPLVRTRNFYMDATTGAHMRQTVWFGRYSSAPDIDPSPLEPRLAKLGITPARSWKLLSSVDSSFLYLNSIRGCGSAPPILQLASGLDIYAQRASDDELRELMNVLKNGGPRAQRVAVERAIDRILGPDAAPAGSP